MMTGRIALCSPTPPHRAHYERRLIPTQSCPAAGDRMIEDRLLERSSVALEVDSSVLDQLSDTAGAEKQT